MNEALARKFINRIQQLLREAEAVKGTRTRVDRLPLETVEMAAYSKWKNSTEDLIIKVTGKNSPHYRNFLGRVGGNLINSVNWGVGILNSLKENLETGFLDEFRDIILTGVFTDFLSLADHLLQSGHKDSSASLIGTILEGGLRKIAQKHRIEVNNTDNMGSLNNKLADAEIYNRSVQKQIQAWKGIRDSAVHAKFSEYNENQVAAMIEGVQNFLAENL